MAGSFSLRWNERGEFTAGEVPGLPPSPARLPSQKRRSRLLSLAATLGWADDRRLLAFGPGCLVSAVQQGRPESSRVPVTMARTCLGAQPGPKWPLCWGPSPVGSGPAQGLLLFAPPWGWSRSWSRSRKCCEGSGSWRGLPPVVWQIPVPFSQRGLDRATRGLGKLLQREEKEKKIWTVWRQNVASPSSVFRSSSSVDD